jgi:hypothetical protein
VYSKRPGPRITPRHEQQHGHSSYGIPIDCGNHVNRDRLPIEVPRAREQASGESARLFREKRKATISSMDRPKSIRYRPPHEDLQDPEARNAKTTAKTIAKVTNRTNKRTWNQTAKTCLAQNNC